MSILTVLVVIVVTGFLLWLANRYIPMQPPFPLILNIVVILILAIWLLEISGLLAHLQSARI